MSGSGKDGLRASSFAVGISLLSVAISLACLVAQVYFFAPWKCSCQAPKTDQIQSQLEVNATKIPSSAGANAAQKAFATTREGADDDDWQSIKKRKTRFRRQIQNQAQGGSGAVLGGYLHNALLRLQQQMIIVEGR